MRVKRLSFVLVSVSALMLSSCSGLKNTSSSSGSSGSTAGSMAVGFTMSAVPTSVPGGISILSFTVKISEISLTSESTGKVQTFVPTNTVVDLNKQLSDSAFLGKGLFTNDAYNEVHLSIESSTLVYCTATTGVAGCNSGGVQTVTGGAAVLPYNWSEPTLGPSSAGLGVRFRIFMANVLVLNSTGTAVQSIDFTQALPSLSELLPLAASLTTGQLDYVEDLTGVVTNVGTSSITLQTASAGTITANVGTTSNFAVPPCSSNAISCATVGQVADIDAILNQDGTFTLLLFDPLDSSSNDWVEGVVDYAPTSASQFQIIVTNFVPATTGSKIGSSLQLGDAATINIANGVSFTIDGKNLTVPANSFAGGTDTSVLLPGQVIAVRASSFTAGAPASVTANALVLRFSRLAGFPGSAGPNFQFLPIGPYFGIQNVVSTYETSGVTNYDLGATGSSVTANTQAAIRALYLGPTVGFSIAKVRQ